MILSHVLVQADNSHEGNVKNATRKEQLQRQVDATLKCAERLQQFAPQITAASAPAPASSVNSSKLPMDLSYNEALARGRELDKCGKFGLAVQHYERFTRETS